MKCNFFILILIFVTNSTLSAGEFPLLSIIKTRSSVILIHAFTSTPSQVTGANTGTTGAGIVLSADGITITNFHTIKNAKYIVAILPDNTPVNATIINLHPALDLALIKINAPFPLEPVRFANSDRVTLGSRVLHIGNSTLLHGTISEGSITGLGVPKSPRNHSIEFIQTNINIYQGDSGGPLFNTEGELLGIMVAKNIKKDRASFAIPSNKIKKLYDNFLNQQYN
jgi:serine protease Do